MTPLTLLRRRRSKELRNGDNCYKTDAEIQMISLFNSNETYSKVPCSSKGHR